MADNFNGNVPYNPGNITKSVWDENSNANRTLVVNSSGVVSLGATEATQLEVLAAIEALEPNSSLSALGNPVYKDYSSGNVTTAAYTQIIADSGATLVKQVNIFDSSGRFLYLAFGAVASEVVQMIICPGGPGQIPLSIPVNTRVSIKAVDATASSGALTISLFG